MAEILWHGIWVSIVGLAILFGAMGLLVVVMMLLERLFRSQAHPTVQTKTEPEDNEQAKREEVAAAIVVALAHLQAQAPSHANLGSTLKNGPGQWWLVGQAGRRSVPPTPTSRWRANP